MGNLNANEQNIEVDSIPELLEDYLNTSVSQFHTVTRVEETLKEAGFTELLVSKKWDVKSGMAYYVKPFASCLFAFVVGEKPEMLRIAASHTDFPGLKIKPNPTMMKGTYQMINTEPYGGLIKSTWFDRPLGVAGKVVLENPKDAFKPYVLLYDSKKPLFIIPSLAPHLKRNDKPDEIDVSKELVPLFASNLDFDLFLTSDILGEHVNAEGELGEILDAGMNILDYDLYLYSTEKPQLLGDEGLFSSPRIDNVSSVAAITEAIVDRKNNPSSGLISIGAYFDNEEIGSRSKQGADSVLLASIIERLLNSLGENEAFDREMLMSNSFVLSCDVAHALHPNYPEKGDPTNKILLGEGFVIKQSASQRYVSDSESTGILISLCDRYKIKYQRQSNKSGMPGGQTLGPIMASYMPTFSSDIGMPILAMHSANELGNINDYLELLKLIKNVL